MICSLIFIMLFHTALFDVVTVLMYRGFIFIILCGCIASLMMYGAKKIFDFIDIKDIILMFCGFCCVNMVLFTLIPVTVERSVSVFMLSYMYENSDETYTQESISDVFVDKYVNEYGAFEKRFDEQLVTGNIRQNDDGSYSITENGKTIVKLFRLISKWFKTDQRLVYPNEY